VIGVVINKPDFLTVGKSSAHVYHVSVLRILEHTSVISNLSLTYVGRVVWLDAISWQ
jgi:hypothetical protein